MEEILASIRLIISDDAKKGPADREDGQAPRPAALMKAAMPAAASPDEEVLDLTEELVFPEEQSAPAAAASPSEPPPAAEAEEETRPEEPLAQEHAPEPANAADEAPEEAAPASLERSEPANAADDAPEQAAPAGRAAPEPRQEAAFRPAPVPSRSLWSRRELPGSPPGAAPASPRAAPQPAAARQAQRNWAEDIQMPILDGGPISLIAPGETQVQIKPPSKEAASMGAPAEEVRDAAQAGLGEKEEAAVAALAESLARSAASAMEEDELETVGDVDFASLDGRRKAEVTESFANAIERESARRDRTPLPTLLDEVFGQDFAAEPFAKAEPAEDRAKPKAQAASLHRDEDAPAELDAAAAQWLGDFKAAHSDDWRSSVLPEEPAAAERSAQAPWKEAPLAQAQFVGTSQPPFASPGGGQTLEDAVRDMLRPLLAEWLNQNMPRILESAIREEIASRGILPKVNK